MNIIRFENIDRIRIRIFWYSNIIRIIFEYRIIRSPLFWSMDCLIKKKVRDLISNHKNSVPPQKLLFKHNSKDWSKAKCAPMTLLASLSWERQDGQRRHQYKKNAFFRAVPKPPNPPPDPNLGNLVLFFGRQNSRFESHLRTNVGRGGRYIDNLKNS